MDTPSSVCVGLLALTLVGVGACKSESSHDQAKQAPEQASLAASVATPLPAGMVVSASATMLVFNDFPVASLQSGRLQAADVQGHVVASLFEILSDEFAKTRLVAEARKEPWKPTLLIAADGGVPVSTVVAIMGTAGRLGISRFAFVVEAAPPSKRGILVSSEFGAKVASPAFEVGIGDDGYVVQDEGGERVRLAKLDPAGTGPGAWDQAGLGLAASQAATANPKLDRAVVSAQSSISTEVLLATFAALLGPGCDQRKPSTCLLSELVIRAQGG